MFWPELARWLGGGTAAPAAQGDSVAMSWCYRAAEGEVPTG